MCITPSFIWLARGDGYEKMPKPCGDCWRCRSNRVNDYVGRCLAEAAYSDWTLTLTLTYAPRDDLADKVINKRHFQDFIRSLRDANHKIRYIAVAEYGDLYGRVHFHTILFGKGPRLDVPNNVNFQFAHWPHGHSFADGQALGNSGADERAIRYVCKYMLKGEKGQYWFTLSKKPVLGAEFFIEKALRDRALGLTPSTFIYHPPGGSTGREYLLSGASRRLYLETMFPDGYDVEDKKYTEWLRKALKSQTLHNARRDYKPDPEKEMENFHFELDKVQRIKASIDRRNALMRFAAKFGVRFDGEEDRIKFFRTGVLPDKYFEPTPIYIEYRAARPDSSSS